MSGDSQLAADSASPLPLEVHDLRKRFGDVVALDALTINVRTRELLAVVGPSGCGKTTLLRIVAGFVREDGGSVKIAGRPAHGISPRDRGVAMVFHGVNLYPHKSVRENLEYPVRARRLGATRARRRGEHLAELLELTHLLDRRPPQLSAGEAQRTALGKALAAEPALLLLDEPLSNLDVELRSRLRVQLRGAVKSSGVAALMVTHDQEEAMAIGDRIAVLRAGRVRQIGTPGEIYHLPADTAVAKFIGSPGMNLILLSTSSGASPAGVQPLLAGDTRKVIDGLGGRVGVVGFRAEDARLANETDASVTNLMGSVQSIEHTQPLARVSIRLVDESVVIASTADHRHRIGERIVLQLPANRLYLFAHDGDQPRLWPPHGSTFERRESSP